VSIDHPKKQGKSMSAKNWIIVAVTAFSVMAIVILYATIRLQGQIQELDTINMKLQGRIQELQTVVQTLEEPEPRKVEWQPTAARDDGPELDVLKARCERMEKTISHLKARCERMEKTIFPGATESAPFNF